MRVAAIASILVGLTAARAAAADASPFADKPTAIRVVGGPLTPVGFLGLEAERTLLPIWSVSVGAGFGYDSPQIAAMSHLLLGGDRSKVTIGAGVSGGHHTFEAICVDTICARKTGTVAWVDLEIGGAHRWPGGLSMRYFAGYGRVVAGHLVCDTETHDECVTNHANEGRDRVYTGFAFGFAF